MIRKGRILNKEKISIKSFLNMYQLKTEKNAAKISILACKMGFDSMKRIGYKTQLRREELGFFCGVFNQNYLALLKN